jgi:hypothetical protein
MSAYIYPPFAATRRVRGRVVMPSYLPAIGPIILALMGAFLTTRSLHLKHRIIWRCTFIVVGVIFGALNIYNSHHQNDILAAIENETRGGSACYVVPLLGYVNPDGFPIMSFNISKYPIFDVYLRIRSHVDSHDPKYILQEPMQTELGTIPSGVKETNLRLPFGYYQIDIHTRYEKYTEMLKFMPFNGQIGVSYRVTDFHGGHVIVQETYPKGFSRV